MNLTTSTLDPLVSWVSTTRQSSTQLDHQADSLLVSLQRIKARARQISALSSQPLTLGFYGYAQAGKNGLLAALQRDSHERIEIMLGDKSLDYLTHINPGNIAPSIGVRFSSGSSIEHSRYPLRLVLFSESELVYQFIARYQQSTTARPLTPSVISSRLTYLESRRLPDSLGQRYGQEIALLLLEYRHLQPRNARFDASLEMRISELAPQLGLNDRAELFSLLWGEESRLTEEWTLRAQLLEQLGNPEQLLAPASLVVDSFMLPAEGFLTPASPHSAYQGGDILVCPVINGVSLPPLNVDKQRLTQVSAEVIFTQKPGSTRSDVDLVDIPLSQLAYYTRRLQPDILLVCNAVNHLSEIQTTGNALRHWVDSTQVSGKGHLPGLIWAITSADSRFKSGVNLDEGVQRRVGLARMRWGTLQAQDSRNMHLLRDWLQGALTPERKAQRLAALNLALEKQTQTLFRGLAEGHKRTPEQEQQQAEKLVRALQTHALQLGSLLACLVPSREALKQCWFLTQEKRAVKTDDLALNIDLFADDSDTEQDSAAPFSYAQAIHHLWINHLRAPLQPTEIRPAEVLPPELWHTLCETLIVTSYRLGLPELLDTVSSDAQRELAIARSHSALGDFVAWLGYAGTPLNQRPLSRINKQQPLFAPVSPLNIDNRLSKLGEQPQRTNASYAYDWLVALYTRAIENQGYHIPDGVTEQQHQKLLKILG